MSLHEHLSCYTNSYWRFLSIEFSISNRYRFLSLYFAESRTSDPCVSNVPVVTPTRSFIRKRIFYRKHVYKTVIGQKLLTT